jgi:glucose uptake protein
LATPTTLYSAQLLLIVAFFLLGLWSSFFKMAGNRWRYELYSFDFAFGAILFSLVAAYTIGAFGTDLGFAEHMMLSSKTNQALAFVGGSVFAIGNILLLCSTALIGLSFAYPIATASAIVALGALEFAGYRGLLLAAAGGAAVLTMIFQSIGAHSAEEILPAVSLPIMMRVRTSASGRSTASKAPQVKVSMRNSNKGLIVAILGGLLMGVSLYPFNLSLYGQFGLGAFAGAVMFFSGTLATTLFVGFMLMNVPIHGGSTSLKSYLRGPFSRHVLGLLGGMFCAAGILLLTIVASLKDDIRPDGLWIWAAGLGAGVVAVALGLTAWHELSGSPGSATRSLLVGTLLLLMAIGAFAMAMDKSAPLPTAQQINLRQPQLPG